MDPRPNVHDSDCPSPTVLDRIGEKWSTLVVSILLDAPQRFSQLSTQVGGVAPRVLTQTLRHLERDGIFTRTACAEIPPRVEDELPTLGRSLEQPIRAITACAERNISQIVRARDTHGRAQAF